MTFLTAHHAVEAGIAAAHQETVLFAGLTLARALSIGARMGIMDDPTAGPSHKETEEVRGGRATGGLGYSIHLDANANLLFGVLWRTLGTRDGRVAEHPVMRRWWAHLADIGQTMPDTDPVAVLPAPLLRRPSPSAPP